MSFEETVYSRTEEGEARARQPRSINSHELRATLLLIDGRLSVRELKRRFGTSLAIDTAISELLRLALIAPVTANANGGVNLDFVKTADGDAAPAGSLIESAMTRAQDAGQASETPVTGDAAPAASAEVTEARPEAGVSETGVPEDETRREPSIADAPAASAERENSPAAAEAPGARRAAVAPPLPPYNGPNLVDRSRGGLIAIRFFLGRLVRGLLPTLAIGGVAVLVVVAFLLPERHRSDIEMQLEAQVGHPVSFGGLRVSHVGGGSLQLSDVRIPALASIQAEQVYLHPDWRASMRAMAWRFTLRLDGLRGAPADLAALMRADLLRGAVTSVDLRNARVAVGGELWGGYSGSVLGDAATPRASLKSADGALVVTLEPTGDALALDAVAVGRPLPVFSNIPLDTYQLIGQIGDTGFEVQQFGAGAMAGKVSARGELNWQAGAVLDAELKLGSVDASVLLKKMGSGMRIAGALSGDFVLRGRAPDPSGVQKAEMLEGAFSVVNGALTGIDLGAALRERGAGKIQGGETRFEALSGTLEADGQGSRVTISALDAGALDGRGRLQVGPLEALSGRMSAAVSAGGRRVRLPVDISGSLAAPIVEVRMPDPAPPAQRAALDAVAENTPEAATETPLEVPVLPGELR